MDEVVDVGGAKVLVRSMDRDEALRTLREVLHGPTVTVRVVNEDRTIVWEHEDNAAVCVKRLQAWVNGMEWDHPIVQALITSDPTSLQAITYRRVNGRLEWQGEEPVHELVDLVLL